MRVCKAMPCDIGEIERIYSSARVFMKNSGNPSQWGDSYPDEKLLKEDIEQGRLYVVKQAEKPCAAFVFYVGEDICYKEIIGKWKNFLEYGVIHRLASDGTQRGIFSEVLKYCFQKANTIRIDTHRDNAVMQRLLSLNGFDYCGIIHIENGEERLAFQK